MNTLIDKAIIRNIRIKSVNTRLFKQYDEYNAITDNNIGYEVLDEHNNIIHIRYLSIENDVSNNLFRSLKLKGKTSTKDNSYKAFVELDMNIGVNGLSNKNCLTIEEFRAKLELIQEFLFNRYGISCDFSESRFYKIELNKTVETEYRFVEYQKLFESMLLYANTSTYKDVMTVYDLMNNNDLGTVYLRSKATRKLNGNCAQQLKFYDKTQEENSKQQFSINYISENLLRTEYTLCGYDKIQNKLNDHSYVYEIEQQDLNSFFETSIKKDFFECINKYVDESNKYLIDKFTECRAKHKRGAIDKFLFEARNFIFDIEQLQDVFATDKIILKNKHVNRNVSYARNKINDTTLDNNFNKLTELHTKLI